MWLLIRKRSRHGLMQSYNRQQKMSSFLLSRFHPSPLRSVDQAANQPVSDHPAF